MPFQHIVCCTDFSENAEDAFVMALELAEMNAAKLSVVHVLPPPVNPMLSDTEWVLPEEPRESLLQKLQDRVENEYGSRIPEKIRHELVVLDGHVSTVILQFLKEQTADMVVVGSYGLTGMELIFFGSVAKSVAHKAPCTVVIARRRMKQ